MRKMNKEYKTFHFEVKAVDDEKGLIEAYGSVFSNIDLGDDVVDAGSFKRTIKGSKSRVDAGKANFLATMLWNHDTEHFLPIGGWYDLEEDAHGLLGKGRIIVETDLGRNVYTLIKEKVINEFSIGYEIMPGGSYYEKSTGVRHLTELRLWEISPVVFAMNQEALLVGVKSLEAKSICGNTSGAIGPRDEAWNGAKANRQIWDAAEKEDGSLNAALAKKYFMVCDGDGQEKGSYSYPFWYVGDDPHICVGAVKAIAGAIQGSRGANAPDGLKAKVETLYKRINAKYKDDPELTPPWEGDGKARGRHMLRKDFNTLFMATQAQDALEDWCDLVDTLTQAMMQAFSIGDEPKTDMNDALEQFGAAVQKWCDTSMECCLPDYMSERYGINPDSVVPYVPGSMRMGGYGYMSNQSALSRKAGRAISAATQATIDDHVKSLKDMAKKAKSDMKAHVKTMHDAIDGMDEGDDSEAGKKSQDDLQTKSGVAQAMQDQADKLHEQAEKAMSIMQEHTKAVNTAATDFANRMQGAETPAYGDGEGVADEDQQEGRGKSQSSPYTRTPAPQQRPLKGTALEDVEIPASWITDIRLHKAV